MSVWLAPRNAALTGRPAFLFIFADILLDRTNSESQNQ
jgi:hypothetical protein